MAREQLVPRYYGSEIEYGYRLPANPSLPSLTVHLTPPDMPHIGQFLQNGARLYQDCGFVEYATPPTLSVKELINHELAGEELAWEAYGKGKTELISMHKRCSSPDGNPPSIYNNLNRTKDSSGAHENYSTAIDIWKNDENGKRQVATLATHFATRSIYIGAGQPTSSGFLLAQKIQHITQEKGAGQTNNKALVNTRDEPLSSGGLKLRRLHVVCGDANLSPLALEMKFIPTSHVIRLMEHEFELSDLWLANPLESAKRVAGGISGITKPLKLVSGRTATALNIQEAFIERANLLSERIELPQEEKDILPVWQNTVDKLKNYTKTGEIDPLLKQIDWVAKKDIIDRYKEEKGSITKQREYVIDLLYDRVPNGLGTMLRKEGEIFSQHTPSRDAIEAAKTTAPPGRSRLLGELIKRSDTTNSQISHVNWDSVIKKSGERFDLGPVEANYTDEQITEIVDNFFEKNNERQQ